MVLLGGVALNWTWSRDDRVAGQAANRLLSGALVPATGVSLEALPKDAWWSSTADHLYLYAVAQGRVEDDPERVEGSEYFLNLARGASPVHPGVLDAQRRVSRAGGGENPAGLVSRDVVTLAREAGQRLRAGDRETGLAMYRRALEMASRSDPEQAEPAEKDSEGESQRYLLPNEDLYLAVLNDLAADGGERFADWSEAVPDYAPVLVSAYRAAHRQGRSDAEQALERAVGQPVAPSGCSEAEHLAGQAEALAILGRWEESAGRYRQAIRRSPVREHRRQYWQNLAEIHGRQGDLAKKHEALEQAWNAGREVPEDDDEGVSKRLRAE
jgi:tetratricopeptide (TPR) repeat protein